MNFLVVFVVVFKYKLCFELYMCYEDILSFILYLDIFVKVVIEEDFENVYWIFKCLSFFKSVGEYLGVLFVESNLCKFFKKVVVFLGNFFFEILLYFVFFIDEFVFSGCLFVIMYQIMVYNNIMLFNDVFVGMERVFIMLFFIVYLIVIV